MNNAETVFFNDQLESNERQGNLFSNNYLIIKVCNVTHIFIGYHTRRKRSNIQFHVIQQYVWTIGMHFLQNHNMKVMTDICLSFPIIQQHNAIAYRKYLLKSNLKGMQGALVLMANTDDVMNLLGKKKFQELK